MWKVHTEHTGPNNPTTEEHKTTEMSHTSSPYNSYIKFKSNNKSNIEYTLYVRQGDTFTGIYFSHSKIYQCI